MPESAGGKTEEGNLAWSCQGCNNHKFISVEGIDPASGELAPLYHPRDDRWVDHFRWEIPFHRLVGISKTGRVTIEKLKLNRKNVVTLRTT